MMRFGENMELYNEYELISHSKLADCSMFIVDMVYRPMHLHKEMELCYILSGTCRVSTDRQSFTAGAGGVLLFDAGAGHEIWAAGAPARILTLQLFSEYLLDSPQAMFACMAQIHAIFALLLQGVPYRVLSDTENTTQTRNAERMHRILHYLETHYSEPVRLSEIAKTEGLTQTYLSHLFREQLHIPFQEYLARLRLEAAMLLLRQSDTTLTDAAYACGFSDPKYLNQSFLKNLGMTPRQWLQENRPAPTGETQSKEDSRTAQHILTPDECRALLDAYGIMPDQIFRIFSSSPLA